jgi:hypothetical protein
VLPAITIIGQDAVRFMPSETFDVGWTLTGNLFPEHALGEQLVLNTAFELKHRAALRDDTIDLIIDTDLEGPTSTGKLTFSPRSKVKKLKTEFTTTKDF